MIYAILTVEYDGKTASVQMTPDALSNERIVGRMVTARLLPKLGLAE